MLLTIIIFTTQEFTQQIIFFEKSIKLNCTLTFVKIGNKLPISVINHAPLLKKLIPANYVMPELIQGKKLKTI